MTFCQICVGGDCYTGPKFAIDAIAAGREGAISLHRYVQPGQSLTLARNPRDFHELDKDNVVLEADCFDAPARREVRHDPEKAKAYAQVLYNQALLIAGLPLEDPSAYTDLLCSLWH